ncbi:helix-turn-helix domain-containing protein [Lysinibacillus agricola]|uniref:helix-turn-helix domain-containing protein n=1 Tax=Lysinibacillus agricola TaxID=2590012 RepID=UPI003C15C0F3
MQIEYAIPGLEEEIKSIVSIATKESIEKYYKQLTSKEWMNISEACEYIGVSFNTFQKFRAMGLKVAEIDGVKRISRKEINQFLESNSF